MSFHQEVNLYLPVFRKEEVPFSGKTILQGGTIIAAALIAITVFSNVQLKILESRLSRMQGQESELLVQIEELTDQKNSRNADSVYREVERLRVDINARRALVRRLGNFKGANRTGFSVHMSSLSSQHLEGLWLKNFSILEGGEKVGMEGKATKASLVPNYIGRLRRQPEFAKTEFGLIKLENRTAGSNEVLGFSLGKEENVDG